MKGKTKKLALVAFLASIMASATVAGGVVASHQVVPTTAEAVNTLSETKVVTDEEELKAALAEGGYVKLGKDIEVKTTIEIPVGVTATLDLAGYAITSGYQENSDSKHIYPLDNYGTLTIMDSVGTGSITGRGIYVQTGSKLTVESGAIYGIDSNGGSALYQYGGDIVINGGLIEQKAEGTYNFAIYAQFGTVTVNGGKVAGNHGAISSSNGAGVEINDGEFVCTGTAGMTDNVLYSSDSGKLTVNGGTFVGDNDAPSGGCCVCDTNGGATINGGTFSNSSGGDVWGVTGTTINGGNFENLTETKHVAVGATIINGGTVYTKTEDGLKENTNAVAVIGGVAYETLAEAVEKAEDGDTVDLFADVESLPIITKAITLNGNNHSVDKAAGENQFGTISGTVTLKNLTFTNGNEAIRTDYQSCDYSNLTLKIVNCKFNNLTNQAILAGKNDPDNHVLKALIVDGCEFTTAKNEKNGSYMVYAQCVNEVTVSNCTFNGGDTTKGAIHTGDSTAQPTVATITGNEIKGVARGVQIGNRVAGSSVAVSNNTFTDITTAADSKAGAVYVHGNADKNVSVKVTDNTATNSEFLYNDGNEISDIVTEFAGNMNNGVEVESPVKSYLAVVNGTGYQSFDEAIKAANVLTGDVTVEIYDKVEYAAATPNLTGAYDSIAFVGKTQNAEIYISRNGTNGYISGDTNDAAVSFENLTLSKVAGNFANDAGFMNVAFSVYRVGSVSYTNCVFPNGACASGANSKITYTNCKFYRSHDKYGLWAYGAAEVTVDGCTFDDYRGIKLYAEGANKITKLIVRNTNFSAVNDKPAIVLTYGKSVTLENNTYSSTGVFELDLDGAPNGTTVTSNDAEKITCKNDNGVCGVLVDGKIYTTVAQAAEVAQSGSTVTLLHDSKEEVKFAKGVILEKNGFAAANVTVETQSTTISSNQINKTNPDQVFITAEISNLNATENVVVKLLGENDKLLATTTLLNKDYFTIATLGVKICITGTSGSWETVWEEGKPYAESVPEKLELWVDGVLTSTAEFRLILVNGEESIEWSEIPGVMSIVAKIGDEGFTTVAKALAYAQEQGMTDVTITLCGETTKESAKELEDAFDLYMETAFDNVTLTQEDPSKVYYIDVIYTGSRTNGGSFVFDNVNIVVIGQYIFEGNVKLTNNSVVKSVTESNCFLYYCKTTVEAGSKLQGIIDDLRGGKLIVDGGRTDGAFNETPDMQDTIMIINWSGDSVTIKNGAYVKVNSANEVGRVTINEDTSLNVFDSKLEAVEYITNNGTINIDTESFVSVKKITGAGKIVIDATDFDGTEKTIIKADLSGFTGKIEVNNDKVEYEITNESLVLREKLVASVNGVGYASLQEAVDAAKDGETVELLADVTLTETISIEKNLTVNGNGFVVAPADETATYASAFMLGNSNWGDDHGETITIKGIVFEGWNVNYGVVRVQGVTLDMSDCKFEGNSVANAAYGVLSLNFADATVAGTTFIDNTGKALDINYNVKDDSNSVVTIDNCTFTENSSTGAGIIVRNNGEQLILKNSTFTNNTVTTNGNAAIAYVGWGEKDEVTGCTFTGNEVITSSATTVRFASAVFADGCTISKNVFADNTATRNGEKISTIVAVGAYYGAADVSGNFWGGNAPVPGEDYTIEYAQNAVEVSTYYEDAELKIEKTIDKVAKVGNYSYATLEEAFAAAKDGETIKLLADVETSSSIVIDGKTITLDLNGKKVIGTDENISGNFYLIDVRKGNLTITDSVGDGAITLTATKDRAWAASSVVVANQKGVVTVKGGTIEHLGGTSMAYGIDNLTNGANTEATLNIEGGKIESTYFAIRQFANKGTNNLNITGGEVSYVWMQSPNNDANVVNINVEGGTVEGVCLTGKNAVLTMHVQADCLGESGVYGTAPSGMCIVNVNGVYTLAAAVAKIGGVGYASLQEAIEAANDNDTVTLLANVVVTTAIEIGKVVTLDLNGKAITAEEKLANSDSIITVLYGAHLTINDSSANGSGKIESKHQNVYAAIKMTQYKENAANGTAKLTVNGGTLVGSFYAITGNGGRPGTEITINGGYLTATNTDYGLAIYHPQDGTLTINGGTLSAQVGIEMRAGKLIVNDGEIISESDEVKVEGNTSGATAQKGIAIMLSQHSTATPVDITVNGGTLKGIYAFYQARFGETPSKEISATIGENVILYGDVEATEEGFFMSKIGDNAYELCPVTLPNAEVISLGAITIDEYRIWNGSLTTGTKPIDLQVALQFLAKDTGEEAKANAFADYTTDFYITITGLENGSFTADGCYLAGNYGIFGWIMIPLDGMVIENGKVYPVITSVGFDFKYVDICEDVKDFKCGIYFSDEVLASNPNLQVSLQLGLSENMEEAQAAQFTQVGDAYTYDAEDLKSEIGFKGANLTIGEDLTVNFYVSMSQEQAENATMKFEFYEGFELEPVTYSGFVEGYGYKFSFEHITPQHFGDIITATLYINGEEKCVKTYSVKEYCDTMLDKKAADLGYTQEQDEAFKTLIIDLLNYGAAAQIYTGYKTDALVNEGHVSNKDLDTDKVVSAFKLNYKGTNGLTVQGATVYFDRANALRIYFTAESVENLSVIVNHGTELEQVVNKFEKATMNGVDMYYVEVPGILATGFDDVYTFNMVYNNDTNNEVIVVYSVNSYILDMLNTSKDGPLVKALGNYGVSAKAFKEAIEEVTK